MLAADLGSLDSRTLVTREGSRSLKSVLSRQCGKFDEYLGGSGITPLKMQSLKVGPLGIPGVTTVMMTALF